MRNNRRSLALSAAFAVASLVAVLASDQPQWGQAWSRNMIAGESNLPDSFDRATGRNVKWTAQLGSETHSTPVIAGGRVYIGTNNGEPRDPKHQGDRGVLMCFDEHDGRFLWQLVVPKREDDPFLDWPNSGISSPVTVEGDRVYIVDNRGEVLCLDAQGMENGNDGPYKDEATHQALRGEAPIQPGAKDGDILWLFDLTTQAGIYSHDAAHSSILVRGDYLYLNTGTGVDNTHKRIRTPDAPSLVVLEKKTGRLVARDREQIAPRIFHSTWSAPSLGEINGQEVIFFCGGNGIVYAFEPVTATSASVQTLRKVWQFDIDPAGPKENVHRFNSNRAEGPSNIYGMPVFVGHRLYVAGGGDIFWGKNQAWLQCLDPNKPGDPSRDALVWSYALEKHVMATPAVEKGLVFLPDCGRTMHCVNAKTGQVCWTDEIKGEAWGSALVADGKVFVGTRGGELRIYEASAEKKLLSTVQLGAPMSATPVAANGVLYIATMRHLYALQKKP